MLKTFTSKILLVEISLYFVNFRFLFFFIVDAILYLCLDYMP